MVMTKPKSEILTIIIAHGLMLSGSIIDIKVTRGKEKKTVATSTRR